MAAGRDGIPSLKKFGLSLIYSISNLVRHSPIFTGTELCLLYVTSNFSHIMLLSRRLKSLLLSFHALANTYVHNKASFNPFLDKLNKLSLRRLPSLWQQRLQTAGSDCHITQENHLFLYQKELLILGQNAYKRTYGRYRLLPIHTS